VSIRKESVPDQRIDERKRAGKGHVIASVEVDGGARREGDDGVNVCVAVEVVVDGCDRNDQSVVAFAPISEAEEIVLWDFTDPLQSTFERRYLSSTIRIDSKLSAFPANRSSAYLSADGPLSERACPEARGLSSRFFQAATSGS
jgi:hypothetical protein